MGVIQWWPQVVVFVKGGLAVSLVFAGIIAVAAGISRYTIRGEDDHHGSSHRPPHEDSKK
ncbi:MAG: hypothetical protein HYZ73_05650 [Elusimicrobia bacterium]|nr:hypothetical protein [Elusimicrobiota bacterium]